MAYFEVACELLELENAATEHEPVEDVVWLTDEDAAIDVLVERGLIYASGRSGAADLVTAHMWFNIAALRGDSEAVRLRRELAAEMSDTEIGAAQRAARAWLKAHPQAPEQKPELRVAA
jgi:uncharacterized protein